MAAPDPTERTMHTDAQGEVLTGASVEGAAIWGRALDELLRFKPTLFDTLDAAIAANPEFALPWVARAYFGLFMTEPGPAAEARDLLAKMRGHVEVAKLTAREQGHVAAADAWAAGDLRRAAETLDRVNTESPRDVLALRLGHELDFFVGDTRNLRDRVARALSAWSEADRHYGFVLACWAFGLEENGHYERSLEAGHRAVEHHFDDVWGIHAVAHGYEMQARLAEGIRFMRDAMPGWGEDNLFVAHDWWHYAIYHLDLGAVDAVFEIYDRVLFPDATPKPALVLLDGASLLWRLHLEGVDAGARWNAMADAWSATLAPDPFYVFNDVHAAMAWAATGRVAELDARIASGEAYVARADRASSNHAMTARVGLPLLRAFAAFARGRWDEAAELLFAVRMRANEFGGSAAQRDVLDRTLAEAALRAGRRELARSLASERTNLRPASPHAWSLASRVARASGDATAAALAAQRAESLRENTSRAIGAQGGTR